MTFTLGYNPASQIVSRVISNNAYLFDYANQNTSYTNNGRNELTNAGGSSFTYDSNRNVTNDGARAYTYDAANRMLSAASTNFTYDPTGALYDIGSHRLASVGGERLALYTTSGGALHRRIVPGASFDEAAAYYHGSGTTTRQWPPTDQLGSVVAYSNASGAPANINTYDEYGRPGSGNAEFLQYTGQLAIASAPGVYNYRARFYQADVGRFLQTDPIVYGDGLNLYAYVGNDPVNRVDPFGLRDIPVEWWCTEYWYEDDQGKRVTIKITCAPMMWISIDQPDDFAGLGPQVGVGGGGAGPKQTPATRPSLEAPQNPNCPASDSGALQPVGSVGEDVAGAIGGIAGAGIGGFTTRNPRGVTIGSKVGERGARLFYHVPGDIAYSLNNLWNNFSSSFGDFSSSYRRGQGGMYVLSGRGAQAFQQPPPRCRY